MTTEELEFIIRQQISQCVTNALHGTVPTETMNQATDVILAAASAPAEAGHPDPPTHYAPIRNGDGACGHKRQPGNDGRWQATADALKVTCGACKRTCAWQAAA